MDTSLSLPATLSLNFSKKLLYVFAALVTGVLGIMIMVVSNELEPFNVIGCAVLLAGSGASVRALRMKLVLEEEGFALVGPFSTKNWKWKDVEDDFGVLVVTRNGIPVQRQITWNFTPEYKKPTIWSKLNRFFGGEASIPAGFGKMNAEDLAILMSRLRAQHLARGK